MYLEKHAFSTYGPGILGELYLLVFQSKEACCTSANKQSRAFWLDFLFQESYNILKVESTLVTLGGAIYFKVHMRRLSLVLRMNKQPSQTDSSLDALTQEPFSFSIFHTAFFQA